MTDGELLLYTFHGSCGHRRQDCLPCATYGCKDYRDIIGHGFEIVEVMFGDEKHYVWKKVYSGRGDPLVE